MFVFCIVVFAFSLSRSGFDIVCPLLLVFIPGCAAISLWLVVGDQIESRICDVVGV